MVNIYTTVNKTKDSLNSDGQHLHQCQQNKQLPLIRTAWTQKKAPRHMT